jgi:thiamine pyrophosphokinase
MSPDLLIGDLDSVDREMLEDLENRGVEIHEHPTRKDQTDLELALEIAVQRNPEEILILGGLGGRWDQTLANILLLAQERFQGPRIRLIDGPQKIEIISAGQTLDIHGVPGAIVSLIAIKGHAKQITTQGLEYELHDGTLKHGASRGISNVLAAETASVSVGEGLLICVIIDAGYESVEA